MKFWVGLVLVMVVVVIATAVETLLGWRGALGAACGLSYVIGTMVKEKNAHDQH